MMNSSFGPLDFILISEHTGLIQEPCLVDSKGKYETAYREEKLRYEKEKENYQPSTWFLAQKED